MGLLNCLVVSHDSRNNAKVIFQTTPIAQSEHQKQELLSTKHTTRLHNPDPAFFGQDGLFVFVLMFFGTSEPENEQQHRQPNLKLVRSPSWRCPKRPCASGSFRACLLKSFAHWSDEKWLLWRLMHRFCCWIIHPDKLWLKSWGESREQSDWTLTSFSKVVTEWRRFFKTGRLHQTKSGYMAQNHQPYSWLPKTKHLGASSQLRQTNKTNPPTRSAIRTGTCRTWNGNWNVPSASQKRNSGCYWRRGSWVTRRPERETEKERGRSKMRLKSVRRVKSSKCERRTYKCLSFLSLGSCTQFKWWFQNHQKLYRKNMKKHGWFSAQKLAGAASKPYQNWWNGIVLDAFGSAVGATLDGEKGWCWQPEPLIGGQPLTYLLLFIQFGMIVKLTHIFQMFKTTI